MVGPNRWAGRLMDRPPFHRPRRPRWRLLQRRPQQKALNQNPTSERATIIPAYALTGPYRPAADTCLDILTFPRKFYSMRLTSKGQVTIPLVQAQKSPGPGRARGLGCRRG